MSMPHSIRVFEARDREPMHETLERCAVFSNEEILVALELMDIFLSQPLQKDYHLFSCANDSDDAIGYICIGRRPMTLGTFDMYWIVTEPAYQGRGIGAALNRYAEDFVKQNNGYLLLAETSSKNLYDATRQFYLARGYRELARIADCYAPGDDLITYGKYFSQSE